MRCAALTPPLTLPNWPLRCGSADPVFAGLDYAQAAAVSEETTIDNAWMRHRYVPGVRFGGDVLFFTATRRTSAQSAAAVWAPYVVEPDRRVRC